MPVDVDAISTNLPLQLNSFIGREREIAEISRALSSTRVLTLIGAGGCGKTRLALEIAAKHLLDFESGVYFVSLARISSPASIVPTIAESLNFSFYEGGDPQKQLLAYLREKQMLLVLDNFEHLREGAGVVSEIIQAAERVEIIATSRERLGLQEEQLYAIQGMDFPDLESVKDALAYDAVKLFLQSARRVRIDFTLIPADVKHLARICRLVEGMPLAVELAAGWVETLSLKEIAGEIQKSADILETDLRNVPERQRSIRAAFNYSWNLLTDGERDLFMQLAVFRGGFTRLASQAITGASPRGLNTLVNKSFLTHTASGRFQIHELLRQYAEERLRQSSQVYGQVVERHSDFYLEWLRQKESELKDRRQFDALAEMDSEIENARTAWMRALSSNRLGRISPATNALMMFFGFRSRLMEGKDLCIESLESANLAPYPLLRAQILEWKGYLLGQLGRTREAESALQECFEFLKLAEDNAIARWVKASALLELGRFNSMIGEREKAKELYAQSLAGYRDLEDQWGTANALRELGYLAWTVGRYEEAEQRHRESLAICQTIGDRGGIASSMDGLGNIYSFSGQLEEAIHLGESSLLIYREMNDQIGIAQIIGNLGADYDLVGDLPKAIESLHQAIALHQDLGIQRGVAWWTMVLSWVHILLEQYDRARQLAENSLALAQEIKHERCVAQSIHFLGLAALGLHDLLEANRLLAQAVDKYSHINQRLESARSLAHWGITLRALGEGNEAWQMACQSLKLASEIDVWYALKDSLYLFAVMLADQGHIERALEIYAMLRRYSGMRAPFFENTFGSVVNAAAASLSAYVVGGAQARGQSLDIHETARELLKEYANADQVFQPIASPKPHDPNALTPREIEVLRLVSAGLSDAKIAEKLVISPRTVNTHLNSIYSKLGVNSRSAATRYALDHKLI